VDSEGLKAPQLIQKIQRIREISWHPLLLDWETQYFWAENIRNARYFPNIYPCLSKDETTKYLPKIPVCSSKHRRNYRYKSKYGKAKVATRQNG
jgi:hypothetical protein